MVKNILLKLLNAISVVIIVLAVVILLNVVLTKNGETPNIMGYSVFRILTGSMEPSIPTNSMVITKKTDAASIKEGDVITFYSRDPDLGGAINTHRVVSVEYKNGKYVYTTRGDANHVDDEYPVFDEDLVGVVVYQSKGIGTFLRLLTNPVVFVPLIIFPLFVIMIKNIIGTIKLAKSIAEEEEKEALKEILTTVQKHQREKAASSEKEKINEDSVTMNDIADANEN